MSLLSGGMWFFGLSARAAVCDGWTSGADGNWKCHAYFYIGEIATNNTPNDEVTITTMRFGIRNHNAAAVGTVALVGLGKSAVGRLDTSTW